MEKPQSSWPRSRLRSVVKRQWKMNLGAIMEALECHRFRNGGQLPDNVLLSMARLSHVTSKDFASAHEKLRAARPSGWKSWSELQDTFTEILNSSDPADSESDSDTDNDAPRAARQKPPVITQVESDSDSDSDDDATQAARERVHVTTPVERSANVTAGIQAITDLITELERANTKLQNDKTSLQQQNADLKRQLQTEAHDYREATAKLSTQMFAAAIDFPGPLERYIADYLPAGLRDQYYKNRDMMKRAGGGRKTGVTGADAGGRASKKRRRTDEDDDDDENVEEWDVIEPVAGRRVKVEGERDR